MNLLMAFMGSFAHKIWEICAYPKKTKLKHEGIF